MDNSGQGAAEYILLFGGVIVIAIFALLIYRHYMTKSEVTITAGDDIQDVRTSVDNNRTKWGEWMDESGQSSAELILIIGGLLIIILVVGNYISHISQTTQDSMNKTLTKERDYVINKI